MHVSTGDRLCDGKAAVLLGHSGIDCRWGMEGGLVGCMEEGGVSQQGRRKDKAGK